MPSGSLHRNSLQALLNGFVEGEGMAHPLSPGRARIVLTALTITGLLAFLPARSWSQPGERTYDARLIGKVGQISRAESVWVGAHEVRLRGPFVHPKKRAAALAFMKALAVKDREIECRLTAERTGSSAGGALVGDCVVFGPTDGREIDLGARLIERGLARPCKEPDARIAIWPPVFVCE